MRIGLASSADAPLECWRFVGWNLVIGNLCTQGQEGELIVVAGENEGWLNNERERCG